MASRQERENLKRAESARDKVHRLRQKINMLLDQLENAAVQEALAWERVESDQGLGG
jgi:hypothetical protein